MSLKEDLQEIFNEFASDTESDLDAKINYSIEETFATISKHLPEKMSVSDDWQYRAATAEGFNDCLDEVNKLLKGE